MILNYFAARSICVLALFGGLATTFAHAQKTAVQRFDLYAGFAGFNTPGQNHLNEIGVHVQAGVNISRSNAAGFDYSVERGLGSIPASLTQTAIQQRLAAELPPGYHLDLPVHVTTQSFSAGSQFVLRRYRSVTLSAHPVLAALHTDAMPRPNDPVARAVSAQLAPSGRMTDWFGAYGVGGGAEFPISRWLGARVQLDAAWNHPFSNLLAHGSVSYRYSFGPAIHFGPKLHCVACF